MNWLQKRKLYESLAKTRQVAISDNFMLYEVDCRDMTPVPDELLNSYARPLVKNLEVIRAHFNKPMLVNSWFRSPSWNKICGGASTSWHLKAAACDFCFRGIPSKEVYNVVLKLIEAEKIDEGGVGIYDGFVHYDNQDKGDRWDNRTTKEK